MEPSLVWTETPARRPDCRYVVIRADGCCAFRDDLEAARALQNANPRSTLFLNGAALPNETIIAKSKVKARKASKTN